MSTKPNNPLNEDEKSKPFIDLSSYYNDKRAETHDDLNTKISSEDAEKLVDDVFNQLDYNCTE